MGTRMMAEGSGCTYVVELRQSPTYAGCMWVALKVIACSGRVVRLGEHTTAEAAKVRCGRDSLGL